MSEFQPNNHEEEPLPKIFFELPDGKYEATPENTSVFLHKDNPQYDLIFIEEAREDNDIIGQCIWRENVTTFDRLVEWMRRYEFMLFETDEVADEVRDMYAAYKRSKVSKEVDATVKDNDPDKHLTPRQQRHVAFLGYLLEHNLLTPEDFEDSNAATI